jgi:hypothetical protein
MEPASLRSMLNRRPFIPFRVHVSDQSHYDVRNPNFLMVGGGVVVIGIARNIDSEYFDEPVIIANRHITRLEPLIEEAAGI